MVQELAKQASTGGSSAGPMVVAYSGRPLFVRKGSKCAEPPASLPREVGLAKATIALGHGAGHATILAGRPPQRAGSLVNP
jgi:hypothetical protein